jgi:hypothetical protein
LETVPRTGRHPDAIHPQKFDVVITGFHSLAQSRGEAFQNPRRGEMKSSFRLLHTIASGGQTGATHPTGPAP